VVITELDIELTLSRRRVQGRALLSHGILAIAAHGFSKNMHSAI
jgi:hypothetical protein